MCMIPGVLHNILTDCKSCEEPHTITASLHAKQQISGLDEKTLFQAAVWMMFLKEHTLGKYYKGELHGLKQDS